MLGSGACIEQPNQHATFADIPIRVHNCDFDHNSSGTRQLHAVLLFIFSFQISFISIIQAACLVSYSQHFSCLSCCKSLHNVMQAAKVQSSRKVERRLQQAIADSTAIETERDTALVCLPLALLQTTSFPTRAPLPPSTHPLLPPFPPTSNPNKPPLSPSASNLYHGVSTIVHCMPLHGVYCAAL